MHNKKIKIMFVISNMNGGGSERMILNLCNNLNYSQFEVVLVLMSAQGIYLRSLNDKVTVVDFGLKKKNGFLLNTISALFKMRTLIKVNRPNIVMSTLSHINLFMSLFAYMKYKSIYYIARESNILSCITKLDPFYIKYLYTKLYRYFDHIIAQSKDMREDMINNFNINPNQITVINNFVDDNSIDNCLSEIYTINLSKDKINLLSVGRLELQKGYDLLIQSFSEITNKDVELTILGQGSEENNLRELIRSLGLINRVHLLGFCENPYAYMKEADLFISSSRFEGFPNVVIEALSCGLPVIANNYSGGINEILSDSLFGEIIDITESFSLEKAIYNNINKDRKLVKEMARKKYSKATLVEQYTEIFLKNGN